MIENVNAVINEIKASEFGNATRKSAQLIWKANMHAFMTTREEVGKVARLVVKEGGKFTRRSRARTEEVVENLSDVANERVTDVAKRFQKGVSKVIHDIGLPTADEVDRLSRRVELLSKKVEAKAAARGKRGMPAKRVVRCAA